MRIVLFFTLFLALNLQLGAFAFDDFDYFQNAQNANFENPNLRAFDVDTLNYLENSIYGKNYPYNSTATRLKKLEKTIFGTSTYGTNSERLKRLSDAYANYKRNNMYSNSVNSTKQNLKRLSKVLFNGAPTGYTPPVRYNYNNNFNPHYVNPLGYGAERIYCDRYGNCTRYSQDIGNTMGVKIIRD